MLQSPTFKDRVPVGGTLQLIYMKGEYPVIMGSNILIDPKKTEVLHIDKGKNLVVDDGRRVLNQIMSGEAPNDPITYFCTGTGGYIGEPDANSDPQPPTGADLDLYKPLFEKEITSRSHPNALATTFVTTITETESIGNLTEFGLKTASHRLFCRKTVRPRYKDNGVFFVARWTIQF